MIIVLAGTTEGAETARLLQDHGHAVLGSALTVEGASRLEAAGVDSIIWGPQDEESLAGLIREQQAGWLVDATHPFAREIRTTALRAARAGGARHIRLERPAAELPDHPLVTAIDSLEEAETHFNKDMTVFSTLGSRHIKELAVIARRQGARLKARIMPFEDSRQACQDAGLGPEDVVLTGGALSVAGNVQDFSEHNAGLVICKESGAAGGLPAKIEAALALQIPILIWKRPRSADSASRMGNRAESGAGNQEMVADSAAGVLKIIEAYREEDGYE